MVVLTYATGYGMYRFEGASHSHVQRSVQSKLDEKWSNLACSSEPMVLCQTLRNANQTGLCCHDLNKHTMRELTRALWYTVSYNYTLLGSTRNRTYHGRNELKNVRNGSLSLGAFLRLHNKYSGDFIVDTRVWAAQLMAVILIVVPWKYLSSMPDNEAGTLLFTGYFTSIGTMFWESEF